MSMKKLPPLSQELEILGHYDWRHTLRKHVAHRASFRCEHCHAFLGLHGDVDHIIARRDCDAHGVSPWDVTNLQYLCAPCHSVKTNRERWDWAGRRKGEKPWTRSKVPGRNLLLAMAGVKP